MSFSNLDLNLLRVLDTVLRERSVSRAAQRLHVTPSAISNGLAKLRDALGDQLVTRQGRGIVPTPRSRELAPILARAMAELESGVARRPFDAASCSRSFTLAMADALQLAWLPKITEALVTAMPRARLRVVGIDSLLALGDLSGGEVDVHIGVRASGPGMRAQALYEDPTVLVMRQKHEQAGQRLTRPRLAALPHVAVELAPGRGFRDPIAAAYARAGVQRLVAVTVPSFTAAAAIVASSEFVATVPRSLYVAHGSQWGLTAARGSIPEHEVQIQMCWHERTDTDPAVSTFRALLASLIGSTMVRRRG